MSAILRHGVVDTGDDGGADRRARIQELWTTFSVDWRAGEERAAVQQARGGTNSNSTTDNSNNTNSSPQPISRRFRRTSGARLRHDSVLRAPEVLIFALGLAALLSLIVFTCDMLSSNSFRPMSVLVFVSAGSYCVVLIRRQRLTNQAEEAMVLELAQMTASEQPPARVLGKDERRALLNYFVFCPPETPGDYGYFAETGKNGGGGGGRDQASAVPGTPPPPYNPDLTESCADALNMDEEKGRPLSTIMECSAVFSSRAAGESAADRCSDISGMVVGNGVVGRAEEEGKQEEAEGSSILSSAADVSLPKRSDVSQSVSCTAADSAPASETDPTGETKGREGKCGDLGAVIRETRNEGELPRCGERDGVIVGDSGDIECGVARKANVLAGDGGAEENNIPKQGLARGSSWEWSSAESCIICFGEYAYGDDLCRLPCRHVYHAKCIDEWLDGANHAWCPLCKHDLIPEQKEDDNIEGIDGARTVADGASTTHSLAGVTTENNAGTEAV